MLRLLLITCAIATACASPPADEAPLVWDGDLTTLRFSFMVPGSQSRYMIEGPYHVVNESAEGIELETLDTTFFEPVQLVVFERGEALWALARIDGQEFLTRLD